MDAHREFLDVDAAAMDAVGLADGDAGTVCRRLDVDVGVGTCSDAVSVRAPFK
jgi:hypothetical protein